MITVSNLELRFGGQLLFQDVNLKFVAGNCYGIIGANGAGKSTFLRILSGEIDSYKGDVAIDDKCRMSVLQQDHFKYDDFSVLDTVIMGNKKLYDIMKEKDALYAKPDFSEEDGMRAADLEAEFAEMNGWDAETEVAQLLNGLGLNVGILYNEMKTLKESEKVKIMLAQALFGTPDILLLDEPTNGLDLKSVEWLEDFLINFEGTVIVVSHDRHFLNTVCTHTVDIDYGRITIYAGNYDFWYQSSQLNQQLMKNQNKKKEEKIAELKAFIQRFSANKSKSKQATSRKKILEKIQIEEMPASNRKYPYVNFKSEKPLSKEVMQANNLTVYNDEGKAVINNAEFRINKEDKIAVIGDDISVTAFFKALANESKYDGNISIGANTKLSYLPNDKNSYFECELNIVNWLSQFTKETDETFIRGFLGRMLFTGEDGLKKVKVLSGGEKVRCMLSKMMLEAGNFLMLDQPTNHLDLESITALNNALIDFDGVVIFASHDHEFLSSIANRLFIIKDGKLIDRMETYDEYISKMNNK